MKDRMRLAASAFFSLADVGLRLQRTWTCIMLIVTNGCRVRVRRGEVAGKTRLSRTMESGGLCRVDSKAPPRSARHAARSRPLLGFGSCAQTGSPGVFYTCPRATKSFFVKTPNQTQTSTVNVREELRPRQHLRLRALPPPRPPQQYAARAARARRTATPAAWPRAFAWRHQRAGGAVLEG